MALGSLCISIDLELAWGIWDKPSADYYARCARLELEVVDRLIGVLVQYEASVTWAIVGRLLDRDDTVTGKTPHGDRIWYAPDVIERIVGARVAQDIGSHSYAHIYFSEISREAATEDLRAARRVHDAHRLPFSSFVFPRNQVAHVDVLRDAGVRVFRSIDRGWHVDVRQRAGRTAGRLANLADKALPVPPAVVTPIDHGGIVELPSSMLLIARNGLRRVIHPLALLAKARLGLERARRTGETFHLWFHPSNFYHHTDRQLETLSRIVSVAARMRDRGQLEIRPMSSYAA
jgi:hypothetical protein